MQNSYYYKLEAFRNLGYGVADQSYQLQSGVMKVVAEAGSVQKLPTAVQNSSNIKISTKTKGLELNHMGSTVKQFLQV